MDLKTYALAKKYADKVAVNKVDKVDGKGLSTNDYTTEEKTKLAGIATNANNYVHPINHSADILIDGTNNKVYTSAEKTKLANTDANATINTEGEITLSHNTIYRRGELAELILPTISDPVANYNSGLQFTSGETPTTVIDSSNAYWQGVDVVIIDGTNVFQPSANKRYGIYFEYDGSIIKAFSEAVAL